MLDSGIAARIKEAIKEAGGYKVISENTGLNIRTLTRITSGETDPKLSNFLSISQATGTSLNYLAFGTSTEQESNITSELKQLQDALLQFENYSQYMEEINSRIIKLENG
ncbi:helix-turn-helix transcriptional regulator [Vibrio crassostreae]|uniref:helix-turn-helix transcriptional regulator n=1 Tax=Vibrio crassostreae TaxID=246167 RepID=UPI0010457FD0|nr:helix-turn-helix transcriptional regulator [Vibrio crassostreae]TCW21824.1 hypothetical protein EDB48_102434 [Vibrio crassostreae]